MPGAVLVCAALGGDDFSDEHVPRRVRGDVVADEPVVGPHRRRPQPFARDEQQIDPFMRPVVYELGPLEQRLDEAIAGGSGRGRFRWSGGVLECWSVCGIVSITPGFTPFITRSLCARGQEFTGLLRGGEQAD